MKKSLLFIKIIILCFIFTSCISKSEKEQTQKEIKMHESALQVCNWIWEINKKKSECVDKYFKSLSLEQKIAQLFIINLDGCDTFRTFESFYDMTNLEPQKDEPLIAGGYLYFSYNIAETPEKQLMFNQCVKNYAKNYSQLPPFLAVDQEGGFVNRLKSLNGPLPSNKRVSLLLSEEKASELYSLQAAQMKLLGFDMNLAPVVEVCTEKNQDFLGERSFGNEEEVQKYGNNCIQSYEKNGISTVLKHFPGNSNTDPHTGLPEIDISKEELNQVLTSWEKLLESNPSAVLMSHARTSALDSENPACLSKVWISDILRNQMNYEGLIISDDIFMGALKKNNYPPEKAVVMAIDAGIDLIMISEKRFSKPAAILYNKAKDDVEFAKKIDDAVKRILSFKIESGLMRYDEKEDSFELDYGKSLDIQKSVELFKQKKDLNYQLYLDYFYQK